MRSLARVILAVVLLTTGFGLAACDSLDFLDVFDSKKKLPGERKPVFPEGVPGVSQGVPSELMKGYQEPPEQTQPPAPTPEQKAATEKPKAKPKPKPVAQTKPQPKPPSPPASNETPAAAQLSVPTGSMQSRWPTDAPQLQTAPPADRFSR